VTNIGDYSKRCIMTFIMWPSRGYTDRVARPKCCSTHRTTSQLRSARFEQKNLLVKGHRKYCAVQYVKLSRTRFFCLFSDWRGATLNALPRKVG